MIRSQILNNAYFSSANDGSLEQVLKSVGFEKGSATMHQTHSSDISFADSNETYISLVNYALDNNIIESENFYNFQYSKHWMNQSPPGADFGSSRKC